MINLIKNEMTKIFRKKTIYILAIISMLFVALEVYIIKAVNNNIEDSIYTVQEEMLKDYNLQDPEELKYFVDEKTDVDMYKKAKEYGLDTWQAFIIRNSESYFEALNKAKYITKNEEEYKIAEKEYNDFIEKIENSTWQNFVKEEKNKYQEEINNLKLALSISSEEEQNDINKAIKSAEIKIKGIDYRLEKNIPPTNQKDSNLIILFETSGINLLDYTENNKAHKTDEEKRAEKSAVADYEKYKYMLDNNIEYTEYPDAQVIIRVDFSSIILFVLLAAILIAGPIVSEEYSKGTIKQLLIKPYTRSKILLSKYISAVIAFIIFYLFYLVLNIVIFGFVSGFNSLSIPIIEYSFTTNSVIEISLFKYCLLNLVAIMPIYLIILSISFMIGTISGNTTVATGGGFIFWVASDIINSLVYNSHVKLFKYLPSSCWDFTGYLFGGTPYSIQTNFTESVIVCLVTYTIIMIISFEFFKRKDIKNI